MLTLSLFYAAAVIKYMLIKIGSGFAKKLIFLILHTHTHTL